jgi:hypothetical protein
MTEIAKMDVREAHAYFAKECFNLSWEMIEKEDRTPKETDAMIHLAHASLYHWSRRLDCTDQNLSIGYWQLSRVYTLAGKGDCALWTAETCLTYSKQHGVSKVFLGYAHEALARAFVLIGDLEKSKDHLNKATEIAAGLQHDEREQLLADLQDLPI